MDILHYLNVAIGFSMVMLVLSMVTGAAAQTWLMIGRTKALAVGNDLQNLLIGLGIKEEFARKYVNTLSDVTESGSQAYAQCKGLVNKLTWLLNWPLEKLSIFSLFDAPKHIGREEFLLLLLKKAQREDQLANELFILENNSEAGSVDQAKAFISSRLNAIEKERLKQEVDHPNLPAYLWTTKAIAAETGMPNLAGKIFSRFDSYMDRSDEKVTSRGKMISTLVALPILLALWPVDAIKLINTLNNDKALSAEIAQTADRYTVDLSGALKALSDCEAKLPRPNCAHLKNEVEKLQSDQHANDMLMTLNDKINLFDEKNRMVCNTYLSRECSEKMVDKLKNSPGIFITWVFVSMGSAFWLGMLNKMLGVRSELGKKLDEQRESRANLQQ